MNKELSKALEVIYNSQDILGGYDDFWDAYRTIETALKRKEELEEEKQSFDKQIEKKLKALEIIKEKNVDVGVLRVCASVYAYEDTLDLGYQYKTFARKNLTQEEYNLLKEILL